MVGFKTSEVLGACMGRHPLFLPRVVSRLPAYLASLALLLAPALPTASPGLLVSQACRFRFVCSVFEILSFQGRLKSDNFDNFK